MDTFWSNESDLCVPFASTAMPRNRFPEILSHLYVNDNLLMPRDNTDHLHILRLLIESLNNHCVKLYNISKQVSTDESMILFKGRSSLKQYNPMKPIKRGYKLWVSADMDGYISKFDVYQGRNTMPKNYNFPACFGFRRISSCTLYIRPASKNSSCLFWQPFFISSFDGMFENQKCFCLCYY